MTLALRFAARSDIGLRREGNEDSGYAGPHLLAIADGMGGHAAGEVASAAVITTVAELDTDHAVDDLPGVVAEAVAAAGRRLAELIDADPAREGMGTTLTALVWAEGHVALGHVGDSRAYLLRDGRLYQVTRDHTKVQALLDQGKITAAEMETHPERSVLMRALDGVHPVRPDVSVHKTMPGDRFMLCSDGLSGVAPKRAIFETLRSVRDPDTATRQLIGLAHQGGAPDNITCVVADVIDTETSAEPPTRTSGFVGAAAESGEPAVSPPDDADEPDLTGSMPRPLLHTRPQSALPDDAALPDESIAELHERIAELEAARDHLEARVADLAGDAAETREEMRELRAALEERDRKDGTRDLAFATQLRDIKKLKAEIAGLHDEHATQHGTGDDTPGDSPDGNHAG